jgi:hypothetical protein
MTTQRLAIALMVAFIPISDPISGGEKLAKKPSPSPSPEWTPGQVVEFQVEALQFNDRPSKDSGIAIAFRFASPENRKVTGPLAHFIEIVKAPGYRPLIDHRIAGYGASLIRGDVALVRVTVVAADGQAVEYEFRLSKDPDSRCWFTDGVIPIPPKQEIDPGKIALASHSSGIRQSGISFAVPPDRVIILAGSSTLRRHQCSSHSPSC